MRRKRPLAERWEQQVQKSDGCWLWIGTRLPKGYGLLSMGGRGGKRVYAHRAAWLIHYGPIPEGMQVCHHCDVPSCVRPDHLFLGTAKDNAQDCLQKGRQASTDRTRHQGADNGRAKVSEVEALAIRDAYSAAPRGQRVRRGTLSAIAARYGISTTMVLNIAKGRYWKHLNDGIASRET